MAFQEPAHSHVLVPLGGPVTDVAQREGRDVDAARQQSLALLGGKRLVSAEDVLERVGHGPLLGSIVRSRSVTRPAGLWRGVPPRGPGRKTRPGRALLA